MYKLAYFSPLDEVERGVVIRIADNTYIPFSNGNKDYQKYLEWLAEGNTPEPADEPETP